MSKKLTLILSALLILSSCTSTKRHNYILLIDNSKSITAELLNHYVDVVEKTVLPGMNRYDRLTIQFIDECVMTQAERVYSLDLDKLDFAYGNIGLNHKEDSTKVRLHRFLNDSIRPTLASVIVEKRKQREGCGQYTDIVNALNGAASLITHEKSYSSTWEQVKNSAQGTESYEYDNIFILFSDMVNDSRDQGMDFDEMGRLDIKQVDQKLENVRSLNKIPDLSGCKIFVYGATSSNISESFKNKQIENVRYFWEAFFKESGAKLSAYSYDCGKELQQFATASAY